jgi:hypothetical protein
MDERRKVRREAQHLWWLLDGWGQCGRVDRVQVQAYRPWGGLGTGCEAGGWRVAYLLFFVAAVCVHCDPLGDESHSNLRCPCSTVAWRALQERCCSAAVGAGQGKGASMAPPTCGPEGESDRGGCVGVH